MTYRRVPIYNATLRERAWMTIGTTQAESRATSDELAWRDLFRALDQPTRVGTTMREVDARRERQGHILTTPGQRGLLKMLEYMDAYGMGAEKAARILRRERLMPCQRAAFDFWKEWKDRRVQNFPLTPPQVLGTNEP